MTAQLYQPTAVTASQLASARCHLERRPAWRTVRINGTRYVSMVSGRSNRVYLVRADSAGCSCAHYTTTWRTCAHMLAVELAAMEEELAEIAVEQPAPKTIESIWAICWTKGCDEDPIAHSGGCHKHANSEAF